MKLYLMRKLRSWALHFEYVTSNWVVPNSTELCCLIENTNTPDFDAYFKRIEELKKRWIIHDSYLESYAVRGRLLQFKKERNLK